MIQALLEFFGVATSSEAANQAQVVTAAISCVAALIAVGAVLAAFLQVRAARSVQREGVARQAYSGYLKLCFAEPAFASGNWQKSFPAIPENLQFEKYEWFVSVMLNACEAILLHVADKDEWIETIRSQIGYHIEYIRSLNFQKNYAPHYSPRL